MFRKIFLFLLAVFVIIQFIHPKANKSKGDQPNAITKLHPIPGDVNAILVKACYDCHSNNTRYPWYANIQPVDWWLTKHIKEGKQHLNFDEYANRNARYRYHKMEETIEMVKEGHMPLDSYLWMHKDARLTDDEKNKVIEWSLSIMDTMKARYPMDSLVRPK